MAPCPLAPGVLPGSKGKTAGQSALPTAACRERPVLPEDPSAQLLADGEAKYLLIDGVDCAYDRPAIERALADNIALSWRLHRDERGGRAFVAFSHPAAERTTLSIQHGAIDFDFNVDPWR